MKTVYLQCNSVSRDIHRARKPLLPSLEKLKNTFFKTKCRKFFYFRKKTQCRKEDPLRSQTKNCFLKRRGYPLTIFFRKTVALFHIYEESFHQSHGTFNPNEPSDALKQPTFSSKF